MIELFMPALLAGLGIAVMTAPMGCFVVWRRMAYFGDSLSHSALLGVALGLVAGWSAQLGIVFICSLFAILLLWLQRKRVLSNDTLLGILAHAALSIGIVAIALLEVRMNLHDYLFGNILTVTTIDIYWIFLGGSVVLFFLMFFWSDLVLATIHEDLAVAENIPAFFLQVLLMFLMTIIVAGSIRSVGILLLSALLIIPAASARQLARSPESMALMATVLAVLAVVFGLWASIELDIPSGPSIVLVSTALFVLLLPLGAMLAKRH